MQYVSLGKYLMGFDLGKGKLKYSKKQFLCGSCHIYVVYIGAERF